jgi:hypothetical protein
MRRAAEHELAFRRRDEHVLTKQPARGWGRRKERAEIEALRDRCELLVADLPNRCE